MSQHRTKKRFGQHFLQDQSVIGHIIKAIAPRPDQHIVEIGPGLGALTTQLLQKTQKLDAIELDRDVIEPLQKKCDALGILTLHQADVLDFDFKLLCTDKKRLRIVGNLPYNISTPLLFHLFEYIDVIDDMCFMLQKEVAQRLAAAVGTGDYGRLSIMTQYYCDTELLFFVGKEAFAPPPKVESAVVRLVPNGRHKNTSEHKETLDKLVKQAFSKRRKTLRNALKENISSDELTALGINPVLRPECISLQDFMKINTFIQAKHSQKRGSCQR